MHYRILGRTGCSVSALSLGTVELGLEYGINAPGFSHKPSETDAVTLVHAALDAGINFIDTARAYGDSERVLGSALHGRRNDVILATKVAVHDATGVMFSPDMLRRKMVESLETSLATLGTDYVDIWLIHNVDSQVLPRLDELAEIFDAMRRAGKIRWSGGSFYGVENPLNALQADLLDVYQVTYSVLDQRVADNFLGQAARRRIGVVARSVMLQGALTERGESLPDRLEPLRQRSRQFRSLVRESELGLSAPQMAIAFALAHPLIQSVLTGVSSPAELAENLHAVEHELTAELLAELEALRMDDEMLLNPGLWK